MRVECQVGTKAVRATLCRVWQAPSTEVLSLPCTLYTLKDIRENEEGICIHVQIYNVHLPLVDEHHLC